MYPNSVSNNTSYSAFNNSVNPYWRGGYNYSAPQTPHAYGYYEEQSQGDNSAKTVGLAVLLQACAVGIQKASRWFSSKLMGGEEYTSAQNVLKVAEHMKKKNKLDVDVHFINKNNKDLISRAYNLGDSLEVVARGENAFYADKLNLSQAAKDLGMKSKIAVAPASKPSLIQHELGHGINATKRFTKLLQKARPYAYSAPTALLLASGLFAPREDGKKNFVQRNAGILGFCASLPTIIEEAIASFRGIKAAKVMNAKGLLKGPVNLNVLKCNYAFALATYILGGIGLGIASKLAVLERDS